MLIHDVVPKVLLDELYILTECECPVDALSMFMHTDFSISRNMQKVINAFHYKIYKYKLHTTSCADCMRRRIRRVRNHLRKQGIE